MDAPITLTRHPTEDGPRWAANGRYLPADLSLAELLAQPRAELLAQLRSIPPGPAAAAELLPPIEPLHEVWASGVTYLRSRDARQAESAVGDVYTRVYEAERPELFFKANGWRVVGLGAGVCIRHDSSWDVPEPEIVLVANRDLEIVGYCAGNDMSSRSIEGANPLYLPQAKIYRDSCALGPGIRLSAASDLENLPVQLEILRAGESMFVGASSAAQMKRRFAELLAYLGAALDFPQGVFLMTGTGVVPPESFTLHDGDQVRIQVGELLLENIVRQTAPRGN